VLAGIGADRLKGGAGRDRLDGEAGDDILEGGTEADILEGGAGRDRIFADTAATLDPLAAIRTAIASGGSPTGAQGDWLSGNDDADLLIGGLGNDGLAGGQGTDVLVGGVATFAMATDASPRIRIVGLHRRRRRRTARTFTGMDDSLPILPEEATTVSTGAPAPTAWGSRGDDAIYGRPATTSAGRRRYDVGRRWRRSSPATVRRRRRVPIRATTRSTAARARPSPGGA
jgi:Ca2+-binding RTX toxin-like protein